MQSCWIFVLYYYIIVYTSKIQKTACITNHDTEEYSTQVWLVPFALHQIVSRGPVIALQIIIASDPTVIMTGGCPSSLWSCRDVPSARHALSVLLDLPVFNRTSSGVGRVH
jgi:hypothetical protein